MSKVILKPMIILIIIGQFYRLNAQNETIKTELSIDILNFFCGEWKGSGAFSNGNKIDASLAIQKQLDDNWLKIEHNDLPPNKFKAISYWGIDEKGQFVAYMFDNFKSHRFFQTEGWIKNKLILINDKAGPESKNFERFVYEKIDDNTFKMKYEVSKEGQKWYLIDFLEFQRV